MPTTPADIKAATICVAVPCENCPFRQDVIPYLRQARVREIWHAATRHGLHFVCHKTVNYDAPADEDFGRRGCAGFMILAHREKIADGLALVQIADRLTGHKFDNLRGADKVYPSFNAMMEAHHDVS